MMPDLKTKLIFQASSKCNQKEEALKILVRQNTV